MGCPVFLFLLSDGPDILEVLPRHKIEIRLDALFTFDHTDLSQSKDIAIEGMDAGAEHYGAGPAAVNTGGNAVERLEGAGKGLLPGKAVVQRDVQQRPVGISRTSFRAKASLLPRR